MRPRYWLILAIAILLLDAITVTWLTARHIASAQVPSTSSSSTAQAVSETQPGNSATNHDTNQPTRDSSETPATKTTIAPQVSSSLPDEVKIEVEPPKFSDLAPGENAHLPEVPSLSTPQLPQPSIDHALVDEMRKIFAEPKSTLEDAARPETKLADQMRRHLTLESIDRRLEIVQHLTASARLMVHEGRNQLASGNSDEADQVIHMSQQLRAMITQLLDN